MKEELNLKVFNAFNNRFLDVPELGIFSPGRINLIGEHTDYNDGFVFPAAIDKGIIAYFKKSESSDCLAIALDMDEEFTFNIKEVPSNPGSWKNYVVGVVHELHKYGAQLGGFSLLFGGDIPKGSGLSSSAALENSIAYGLNELFDLKLKKEELIFISQKAEHNYVGVNCGIMDQYASMFGKDKKAFVLDCRSLETTWYNVELNGYLLLLINSNVPHQLAEAAYNARRLSCEKVADLLEVTALRDANILDLNGVRDQLSESDYLKAKYIIEENGRVINAAKFLNQGNLDGFGELLFDAHNGMKNEFEISCKELDFLVKFAKDSGVVLGSRLMGGGFGGCTINIIKNSEIENFKTAVGQAYYNEFERKCTPIQVEISEGTRRIK